MTLTANGRTRVGSDDAQLAKAKAKYANFLAMAR